MSKTEEEFHFVRCTVADMKNLYVSCFKSGKIDVRF